jgi:hypothetical protein
MVLSRVSANSNSTGSLLQHTKHTIIILTSDDRLHAPRHAVQYQQLKSKGRIRKDYLISLRSYTRVPQELIARQQTQCKCMMDFSAIYSAAEPGGRPYDGLRQSCDTVNLEFLQN